MPLRILSLVKIEHPARGLIQNSRFGFLATVDDISSRLGWTSCGALKRRSPTFLARDGAFLSTFMTLGRWIGVDRMLAPFRETVKI
jgi:hypothetical protein